MSWIERRRYEKDPRTGEWLDANPPAPGDGFFVYMGEPERQRARRRREVVYNDDGSVRAERDTLDLEQRKAIGSFNPTRHRQTESLGSRIWDVVQAALVLFLWGLGMMVFAAFGHLGAPDTHGFEKAIGLYVLVSFVLMLVGARKG